jgi:hypothetical protein
LKAPVLQRAQRLYGNRASNQIVMRARTSQRHCACGGTCANCQEDEEQRVLQRSSPCSAPAEFDGIPTTHGQPLDPPTRRPLEAHFGADLTNVRVHTDTEAAESATRLDALAYTVGRDIYFAQGKYAPSSSSGRHLLAHEIAHVVQQSAGKGPAVAAKSAGVKIGAPDDSLEAEAERKAEDYLAGGQLPPTEEEERNRREAGIPVQRFIQRQGPASAPAPPPSPQPSLEKINPPIPFLSLDVNDDPVQLESQMRDLVAHGRSDLIIPPGIDAPYNFANRMAIATGGRAPCGEPSSPDYAYCHRYELLHGRVLPVLFRVVDSLREKNQAVIDDFGSKVKAITRDTLAANKTETDKEAARYGIKVDVVEHHELPSGGVPDAGSKEGATRLEEVTTMQTESPASKGLSDAAKVLLEKRTVIDQKKVAQEHEYTYIEHGMKIPNQRYYDLGKEINDLQQKYATQRGYLDSQYPILAEFSDLEKDPSALRQISQGPGTDTAVILAARIQEVRGKIKDSQDGLDDGRVNVWKLPRMVELARAAEAIDADPMRKSLIEEHVRRENDGLLDAIASGILNIAALLLAGPTGGLSLAIAAGVNAALLYKHVQDYMVQSALSGSAFDKAKAISQDEPSLFWLAFELVGTVLDVGTAGAQVAESFAKAVGAFAKLRPAVEIAEGAAEGAELEKSLNVVSNAANEAGVAEKADTIIAHIRSARKGGTPVLESLKEAGVITENEAGALRAAGQAAEQEAKLGAAGLKAVEGPVKVSRAGHIFSCHSPCQWLLEKYLDLLGPEIKLKGESSSLRQQYLEFEKRAEEAAARVRTAPPEKLAEAEEAAASLEKEIAQFDQKLASAHLEPEQRDIANLSQQLVFAQRNKEQLPGIVAKLRAQRIAGQRTINVNALSPQERKVLEQVFHDREIEYLTLADLEPGTARAEAEVSQLKGELAKAEEALAQSYGLHRPSLRDSTKRAIERAAKNKITNPDGSISYRDPDGIVRQPPWEYGHITGMENRRLIKQAGEQGMTQEQFNDWVNSHPEFFRIESKEYNQSHLGELLGSD